MNRISVSAKVRYASIGFATLATLALLLFVPPKFEADATLKPVGTKGSLGSLAAVANQLGVGLGISSEEQSLEYFITLLTSRGVLIDVLKRDVVVDSNEGPQPLHVVLGAKGDTDPEYWLDGVERLRDVLSVSPDIRAGLIRLTVKLSSPDAAETVALRVITLADSLSTDVRRAQARDERRFLEERVEALSERLEASERDLQDFLTKNRSVSSSPELQLEIDRRRRRVDLAQQLVAALQREVEAAGAEEARNTATWAVIEGPIRSARTVKRPYALIWIALTALAGISLVLASGVSPRVRALLYDDASHS